MTKPADLNIVKDAGSFPRVTLVPPHPYGYVVAGAVIDRRLPFAYAIESRRKRRLLTSLKAHAETLKSMPGVRDVVVLKTLVQPPGRGALLKKRPNVHVAHYDVAIWLEADDPDTANAIRRGEVWQQVESLLREASADVQVVTGRNVRRMGDVDHTRDGVFLINYFYADRVEQNLAVWEYTAGWFQDQTNLHNSILLLPQEGSDTDNTVINHCRWDKLRNIMPALVFKPSFRRYVLANFEANDTAAIPILYRLA